MTSVGGPPCHAATAQVANQQGEYLGKQLNAAANAAKTTVNANAAKTTANANVANAKVANVANANDNAG